MVVLGQPRDLLKYGKTSFSLHVLQSQILIRGFLGFQGLMLSVLQTTGVSYIFCLHQGVISLLNICLCKQGLLSEFSVVGSSLQVAKVGNFVLKCDCLEGLI